MKTINNNIQEDYVDFEIAKLLKEKGFNCKTNTSYCWFDNTKTWEIMLHHEAKSIKRPTIQLVVKWIYENFGIWIYVSPNADFVDEREETLKIISTWTAHCEEATLNKELTENFGTLSLIQGNSPQEAYQEAIKYTLKNLI